MTQLSAAPTRTLRTMLEELYENSCYGQSSSFSSSSNPPNMIEDDDEHDGDD